MKIKGGLLDRISPQFWFIFILESVFLLFTQQDNSLSAFHLVCAFVSPISKVYFVKFYICISSCVHVLNVCTITEGRFNVKVNFFSYYIFFTRVC